MKPRLLDLFCKAGGTSMGYHRAGFDVVGVDIEPQPHYPFTFIQGDALAYLMEYGEDFAAFAASPPCQRFTNAQRIQCNQHPDYVSSVRQMMQSFGKPYVIENVPGAPLVDPIVLCGAMFGNLRVYRHRLFESNIRLFRPAHPMHLAKVSKMGRPPKPDEFMHVVGNFSGVQAARVAMGIDWMTRDELREAIPPAYTEFVGHQLMAQLRERAA